jgi:hypothetical protein
MVPRRYTRPGFSWTVRASSGSMVMQQTAQRMTPIDVPRMIFLRTLAMLLPQLIGKQKRHYQQRHDQKRG